MFERLQSLPADPILGLIASYNNDPRAHKIDVGVGVYRDEHGHTPILRAVQQAQIHIQQTETSKTYIASAGNPEFNQALATFILGDAHPAANALSLVQAPGGCGALRVGAEFIKRVNPGATIWVSDPTWGNHVPLLGDAGINLRTYPYYDFATHTLKFDEMLSVLSDVPAGDLVLLHACCHNPSGADLSEQQWQAVADLAEQRGFVPFIDMAYQGLGRDPALDAYGLRLLCERLPEVVMAVSCSKNFGLYRERVGAVGVISNQPAVVTSHMANIVRGIYSMPPNHGAAVVAHILKTPELQHEWLQELTAMRERIQQMRSGLVNFLRSTPAGHRFDHVEQQRGMFSFLGLSATQVQRLAKEHGVYMVDSSRINIAGLTPENIPLFAQALNQVL